LLNINNILIANGNANQSQINWVALFENAIFQVLWYMLGSE